MHKNNFGFLRLLFASLVIVSHSSEIIDGNRSRELLTMAFGTLTFGEVAVDAFFIISGYLVLKSFETSASPLSYLVKRVRRIFPGYLAAYIICVFVIGPFVDIEFRFDELKQYAAAAAEMLTLRSPSWPAFRGLPVPALNGSAWTIIYEFKCYLYLACFGWIGLLRKPALFAMMTAALLISNEIHWPTYIGPLAKIVGYPSFFIRLEAMFCVGGCFYLFRDRVVFKPALIGSAALALLLCLYFSFCAEAAFALFGGYLIFWTALGLKSPLLMSINGREDISYGVYLYAWPIQGFLVYFLHVTSPRLLFAITIPLAYVAGFLSWRLIERPFLPKDRSGSITSSKLAFASHHSTEP